MSYKVDKNTPRECEKCKYVTSNDKMKICAKCGNDIGIVLDPYEVLRNARCSCCNWPIYGDEVHLKFLLKRAEWKNPIGVIPNLKEGVEDVPRAMAVVCSKCKDKPDLKPKYAIKFDKDKIKYIPVDQLQDTFEITPDMLRGPEK